MKKFPLTLVGVGLLALQAHGALVIPTNGLVAQYTFEGADTAAQLANKATDVTALNYGLTAPNGGVTIGLPISTLSGNAATFGGATNSLLNTTYASSQLGATYTIGGYFYFPSTNSARTYAFETENGFDLSLGTSGGIPADATPANLLPYSDGTAGTAFTVPRDTWVQLTVVANGNNVNYYRNGVSVYSATNGAGITFEGFNFGNARTGTNRGSVVSVDELYIYNRALSADEISAIPEPSAAVLGGLGMLALLRRRRRA